MTESTNLPAHSLEAEQAVLGCLLTYPVSTAPRAAQALCPEHFAHSPHRTIFAAALTVWYQAGEVDLISLTVALRESAKLDAVGGPAALTLLIDAGCPPVLFDYHAQIVREKAALRQIERTCRHAMIEATAPGTDSASLAGKLAALLAELTAARPRAALALSEHLTAAVDRYEAAFDQRGQKRAGVYSTGLSVLDAHTEGGLHPGDLVILAAETSGGKTALAVQLAGRVGTEGGRVLFASYEMTAAQLTDRLISHESKVPASILRSGLLNERQMMDLGTAVPRLRPASIHLRDGIGHWSVDDLATEARAVKAQHGLEVLVVDYLQLVAPRTASRGTQRNREREVAEISRGLKGLATELNITVLALSQLNEDGRLRESRAIGQDADAVLIIGADPDAGDDRRQIYLDKNRHGARDKHITVAWNGPLMQYADAPPRKTVSHVKDL